MFGRAIEEIEGLRSEMNVLPQPTKTSRVDIDHEVAEAAKHRGPVHQSSVKCGCSGEAGFYAVPSVGSSPSRFAAAILDLPPFESGSACEIDISPAESVITV